jgi:hypothetical protein
VGKHERLIRAPCHCSRWTWSCFCICSDPTFAFLAISCSPNRRTPVNGIRTQSISTILKVHHYECKKIYVRAMTTRVDDQGPRLVLLLSKT